MITIGPQDIDLSQSIPVPPALESDPTVDSNADADAATLNKDAIMIPADQALASQLAHELEQQDSLSFADKAGPHRPSRRAGGNWSLADRFWDNKTLVLCNSLLLPVSLASVVVTSFLQDAFPASPPISAQCQLIPQVNATIFGLECAYFVLLALRSWYAVNDEARVVHELYLNRRISMIRQWVKVLYDVIFWVQLSQFWFAIMVVAPVASTFHTSCPQTPPAALAFTLTAIAIAGAFMLPLAIYVLVAFGYLIWLAAAAVGQWCAERMGIVRVRSIR